MQNDRQLLISLGAQKAGTSWLADYLRDHPSFSLPPIKEVHYFDYLDLGNQGFGPDSPKMALPHDLKRKFSEKLARQYDYVEQKLRALPERWQINRAAGLTVLQ